MPLPSRADVLRALRAERGGATARSLANLLGVTKKDMTAFKRLLRDLRGDEAIVRTGRSRLGVPSAKLQGEFLDTGRGFGFVRPQAGGADIFIQKWARAGARDGDIVELDLTNPERGAGRVVRVLERLPATLGIVARRGGGFYLLPFRRNLEEIEIGAYPPDLAVNAVVRVALEYQHGSCVGRVVEVLGDIETDGIEERVVLEMHRRPVEFALEALAEADVFRPEPGPAELAGRGDYRDLLCFTIDPDDAKDFDDAVSLRPGNAPGMQILGVHIADVSHFVVDGSALDTEACARGCSVYFPRGVVPMLPPRLSGDLCSLRAGVDRLAFSVMMEVDGAGNVLKAEFHPSVIRSAARLTYGEAQAILDGGLPDSPLRDTLHAMKDLSEKMSRLRRAQGSLDFDLPEPEFHFDTEGDLVHITPYPRLASHRLVEEFMLAANEAVARFLDTRQVPTLYRVHEYPLPEKVEELNDVLDVFHLPAIPTSNPEPRDFQRAIDLSQKRVEEKFLTYKILRALMLARYATENLGHFGLAKSDYLHFTSPIRRYPDLICHRALRVAIGAAAARGSGELARLAESTSSLERDAEEIEREVVTWKVARFMRKHLGEVYDATVVGFSSHHFIVELDGLYVEGKVRVDSLPGRWELDECWVLRSRKKRIQIGDRVRVQVVSVDMRRRETVFLLER